jgi:hypothetical protein
MAQNKLLIKIDARIDDIDKTLVRQEENLKQHMYRTELAEKRLELIEEDIQPIKDHVNSVKTVLNLIAFLLGSGALLAFISLFK